MANEIIRPTALPARSTPSSSEVTVSDDGSTVAGVTWADGVNAAVPVSSQAESEAGVNNSKRMTPLTTKQAIDYQVPPKISTAIGALNLGSASQASVGDFATAAQGAKADSAVQPGNQALVPAGGTASQVLIKSSNSNYDTAWATSASATAVSYAPQTLTEPQKIQARNNINALTSDELGNAAFRDVGTGAGTVAEGDDARIVGAVQKDGGTGLKGYAVSGKSLGNLSGSITPTHDGGNYQAGTITGALTINAPTAPGVYDLKIELLIGAGAGAVTLAGFDNTDFGEAFTTTEGDFFILQIEKGATRTIATVRKPE